MTSASTPHETKAPLAVRAPTDAYRDAPGAPPVPLVELGVLEPGECYEVRWLYGTPPAEGMTPLGDHHVYHASLAGRRVRTEAQ